MNKDFDDIKARYPKEYRVYSFIPADWMDSCFYLYRERFCSLCVTSFLNPEEGEYLRYAALVTGYSLEENGICLLLMDPYRGVRTQPLSITLQEAESLCDKIIILHGSFLNNCLVVKRYATTRLTISSGKEQNLPQEYVHTHQLRDVFGKEASLRALDSLCSSFQKKGWGVTRITEDICIFVTPDFLQFELFIYQNRPFVLVEESPLEKRQAAFEERYIDLPFFDPEVNTEQFLFFPDEFRHYVDKAFVDRAFHFSR